MAIQKNITIAAIVILIAASAIFINANNQQKKNIAAIIGGAGSGETSGKYDTFAKCLTDKGIKLYGAYWCPHCQDQKKMFGESIKYVNYIECAIPGSNKQAEVCSTEGISGYPTWKYADGSKEAKVKTLQELSDISGCAL